MLSDNPGLDFTLSSLSFTFQIGFIVLAIAYFIFALIIIRQINLMTETVTTEVASLLKILSLVLGLLSLGVVIWFIRLI